MNPYDFRPLLGMDEVVLDVKGRVSIGKKRRDRIGENFAMFLGKYSCIVLMPEDIWQGMLSDFSKVDPEDPGRHQFARIAFGSADDELNFDNHGRILIPQALRDIANLNERVLVIGCYDHVEIWSPEEYRDFTSNPDGYKRDRREAYDDALNGILSRQRKSQMRLSDLPELS